MIDLDAFRLRFPEFSSTPDELIESYLAQAERRIDAETWGALEDDGHALLTAHLLVMSPYGQSARMTAKDQKTATSTYGLEYERLVEQVSCLIRTF